ncbi:HD domain-containing protein [Nocardia asiatica]|uniref:HD domain-containing protein n=1 Tax=Nocardia asiatica TaxID=209252 RepID=UPI003EE38F54
MAGDIPAVLVTHGVQCAELLTARYPEDSELQLAGLLHDIGLLLVPGDELGHPKHAADYVRNLFGDRVADIIALHVDAQRYLEATAENYLVAPPPTAAFAEQPDSMTDDEIEAFLAEPLASAALSLREADDAAADETRREHDFGIWIDLMERVHKTHGPSGSAGRSLP